MKSGGWRKMESGMRWFYVCVVCQEVDGLGLGASEDGRIDGAVSAEKFGMPNFSATLNPSRKHRCCRISDTRHGSSKMIFR